MKKTILIILCIVVLAGAAAGWYFLQKDEEVATQEPSVSFPIAGSDTAPIQTRSTLVIQGQDGSITVNDFLKSSDVAEDPTNPGYYYLGNQPRGDGEPDTAPYQIIYIPETNYFNVVLLAEPIGEVRRDAEQYLMGKLGIAQADMCNLIYTVSVPDAVNTRYTGINLGFSFCPDAVVLP